MQLLGKSSIVNFMGKRWSVVETLIREEGFPARRLDGLWQADTDEIDAWRRGRPARPIAMERPGQQFRQNYDGASTEGIIQVDSAGSGRHEETQVPVVDSMAGVQRRPEDHATSFQDPAPEEKRAVSKGLMISQCLKKRAT